MKAAKVYAQMTLGYRYDLGAGGVPNRCRASVLYYEPAAYEATQYVMKSHALDIVEMKKLKLEAYILDSKLQLDEKHSIEVAEKASHNDIEEMLEFKGEYGNSDSLAMKGLQYMHAPVKDEYTYQQAYHYFERALEIDAQDP
jgi:hypothetical protein